MQLGDARSGKMADNITAFGRTLRRAGVPVDSARIALALDAVMLVGVDRRDDFRAALEAVLVSREQDREVFSQVFDAFFRNPEWAKQLLSQMLPKTHEASQGVKRLARVQEALKAVHSQTPEATREQDLQFDAAMTASDMQRLREADFQQLSASEFCLIERLVRETTLPMPEVPGRRTRVGVKGQRMDWPRAMAEACRLGGELLYLPRRIRRSQPLPLLILIDISGSMERYARLMLAFLHQATRAVPRAAFAFGTELSDLRQAFKMHDTDAMLVQTNRQILDFAGGTRLGASLATLHQRYPQVLVGRRTVVMLISDGLDTGDMAQLKDEVAWLKRHSRALLWLNPLLRYEGYEPVAGGAQVLHAQADGMLAIHNLAKLEQLAAGMADLLRGRCATTATFQHITH